MATLKDTNPPANKWEDLTDDPVILNILEIPFARFHFALVIDGVVAKVVKRYEWKNPFIGCDGLDDMSPDIFTNQYGTLMPLEGPACMQVGRPVLPGFYVDEKGQTTPAEGREYALYYGESAAHVQGGQTLFEREDDRIGDDLDELAEDSEEDPLAEIPKESFEVKSKKNG